MSQMYHWSERTENDKRPEGSCEYSGCGRPSWSYSDRYTAKPATTLVVFIPTDPDGYYAKSGPKAFLACGLHAGVVKRSEPHGYVAEFHKPIPADREATIAADVKALRAAQDESKRARDEYIEEHRAEKVEEFLTGKGYQPFEVKLTEANEFGLRHIKVGHDRYHLNPQAAERLAAELMAAAKAAREAVA